VTFFLVPAGALAAIGLFGVGIALIDYHERQMELRDSFWLLVASGCFFGAALRLVLLVAS